MTGRPPDRRLPLGQPDALASPGSALMEWLGAGVALVWTLVVLVWGLGLAGLGGTSGILFLIFAVALPMAMLGLVVLLLRQIRDLRLAAQALAGQMQALRSAEARDAAARVVRADEAGRGGEAGRAGEVGRAGERAGGERAGGPGFATRRDPAASQPSADGRMALAPPQPAGGEDQPTLALATPMESDEMPLEVADFIRAIQFPEDAEDVAGFAALRRALSDRAAAKLIRASQDVLTLLAQDGIYMDDLVPDRARPDLWRRFAAGERGRTIAALGGIRDRSCLALTGQKMREDPVFRDAAHHFLRSFDRAFAAIEPLSSDEDIGLMSDTRTARAFMLVGRVAGTFD